MSRIELGHTTAGQPLTLDVPRLVETRLLVQANSGGGKSWLLRRLLEQTHGAVQHLVIDPEGEFATVRERYGYVLAAAGDGGDCPVEPRSAHLLARKLMELRVSAILDIYELKQHERIAFVERFLTALVNLPKRLWHPVLVVVDEAHVFCPEQGKAASGAAVVDLATRGRKRGMCAVLATQRLSKLRKDAAAELNNVLIGRTGLDVDMARAGDALGMVRGDRLVLRGLGPGAFFAFGPAVADGRGIHQLQVGGVATTHPTTGSRVAITPPPPTDEIRAVLSELASLSAAAVQETQDVESLRRENASLRGRLRHAEDRSGVDDAEVNRRVATVVAAVQQEANVRLRAVVGARLQTASTSLDGALETVRAGLFDASEASQPPVRNLPPALPAARTAGAPPPAANGSPKLRAGERKILDELARRHPLRWTRAQVATLTGYAVKGGTFGTYLGVLRRHGLIDEDAHGVGVTPAGYATVGAPTAEPPDPASALEMWCHRLRRGEGLMLRAVVAAGADGIARYDLAIAAGYELSGGTFGTYLGVLRRNGLIEQQGDVLVATDVLRPSSA